MGSSALLGNWVITITHLTLHHTIHYRGGGGLLGNYQGLVECNAFNTDNTNMTCSHSPLAKCIYRVPGIWQYQRKQTCRERSGIGECSERIDGTLLGLRGVQPLPWGDGRRSLVQGFPGRLRGVFDAERSASRSAGSKEIDACY